MLIILAFFLRRIVLSSVACLTVPCFLHIISETARFSEKDIIEHQIRFG